MLTQFTFLRTATSATTRPQRPGEIHGREYYFLSDDEFAAHISADAFVEHVIYAGNRYGTLRTEINRHLDNGDSVVLEIELRGARAMRTALPEAISVFIEPPSFDELARRVRARNTESEEAIQARLAESRVELDAAQEFNYRVQNENIDDAARDLAAIVDLVTRST